MNKKITTNNSKEKPPCQYTLAEIKERIKQGRKDAKKGLGATTEEMRKLHPRI